MSGDSHKRTRNRWGTAPTSDSAPAAGIISSSSVSDEDALRALLSETAQHQQSRRTTTTNNRGVLYNNPPKRPGLPKPRETRDRHDSGTGKRPRWSANEKLSSKETTAHDDKNNYYGPAAAASDNTQRHVSSDGAEGSSAAAEIEKKKPDFGLSGALARDQSGTGGSNVYKGVLLKFQEPPEARTPKTPWRLYVFRGDEQIDTLHVSKQSAYLFARNEDIADIPLQHPSCSSQHAVLQFRAVPSKDETGKLTCQPYLMDLESTNGSFINGVRIDPARYYQLKKGDVLKFGASTREYVLLTANTKSVT